MLLGLDHATLCLVLERLPAKDLIACAASCQELYTAVATGSFASQLWQARSEEELGPQIAHLHHAAAVTGAGLTPGGYARFWRRLYSKIATMDEVFWWSEGSKALDASIELAGSSGSPSKPHAMYEDGQQACPEDAGKIKGNELRKQLARAGGGATLLGENVVLTGGILREGAQETDVIVINLRTLSVARPVVHGKEPISRFRHSANRITPLPGSLLHEHLLSGLGEGCDPASGHTLLLFGGYNTSGNEFGGNQLEVLWVNAEATHVTWIAMETTGETPGLRFHHCAHSFDEGLKLVLYGGEGSTVQPHQEDALYILDVNSLTWSSPNATGDVPGPRSLHQSTLRTSPETGHMELVLMSGYAHARLADMRPYTLDLATLAWTAHPGCATDGAKGFSEPLPQPRQRTASYQVSSDWLLVHGGSPPEGPFLDDVQRLHLPTLTWAAPVRWHGRPTEGLKRVAGHLMQGLLTFGGCIPTAWGIMPVAKMDLLLVGSEQDYTRQPQAESSTAATSATLHVPAMVKPEPSMAQPREASKPKRQELCFAEPPTGGVAKQQDALLTYAAVSWAQKGQAKPVGGPSRLSRDAACAEDAKSGEDSRAAAQAVPSTCSSLVASTSKQGAPADDNESAVELSRAEDGLSVLQLLQLPSMGDADSHGLANGEESSSQCRGARSEDATATARARGKQKAGTLERSLRGKPLLALPPPPPGKQWDPVTHALAASYAAGQRAVTQAAPTFPPAGSTDIVVQGKAGITQANLDDVSEDMPACIAMQLERGTSTGNGSPDPGRLPQVLEGGTSGAPTDPASSRSLRWFQQARQGTWGDVLYLHPSPGPGRPNSEAGEDAAAEGLTDRREAADEGGVHLQSHEAPSTKLWWRSPRAPPDHSEDEQRGGTNLQATASVLPGKQWNEPSAHAEDEESRSGSDAEVSPPSSEPQRPQRSEAPEPSLAPDQDAGEILPACLQMQLNRRWSWAPPSSKESGPDLDAHEASGPRDAGAAGEAKASPAPASLASGGAASCKDVFLAALVKLSQHGPPEFGPGEAGTSSENKCFLYEQGGPGSGSAVGYGGTQALEDEEGSPRVSRRLAERAVRPAAGRRIAAAAHADGADPAFFSQTQTVPKQMKGRGNALFGRGRPGWLLGWVADPLRKYLVRLRGWLVGC